MAIFRDIIGTSIRGQTVKTRKYRFTYFVFWHAFCLIHTVVVGELLNFLFETSFRNDPNALKTIGMNLIYLGLVWLEIIMFRVEVNENPGFIDITLTIEFFIYLAVVSFMRSKGSFDPYPFINEWGWFRSIIFYFVLYLVYVGTYHLGNARRPERKAEKLISDKNQ